MKTIRLFGIEINRYQKEKRPSWKEYFDHMEKQKREKNKSLQET